MRYLLLLILFASALLSPQDSWAEKRYRVILFGDSLFSGLQGDGAMRARMEQKLHAAGYEHLEVLDMSTPGMTATGAIDEAPKVAQKMPDVVLVSLGYNDMNRGVLPSAISFSLSSVLHTLKLSGAYVILTGAPVPAARNENYAYEAQGAYHSLATASNAFYPSITEGIRNAPALTMADGVHPNSAGVDIIVDALLPLVDTGLRWRYEVYLQQIRQQELEKNAPVVPQ